jgi:hypothetical protein
MGRASVKTIQSKNPIIQNEAKRPGFLRSVRLLLFKRRFQGEFFALCVFFVVEKRFCLFAAVPDAVFRSKIRVHPWFKKFVRVAAKQRFSWLTRFPAFPPPTSPLCPLPSSAPLPLHFHSPYACELKVIKNVCIPRLVLL